MNLIAILAALGLEQWRAFHWRGGFEQLFRRYARALERRFNGGTAQQGAVAGALALVPPVLLAAAASTGRSTQLSPLLGLAVERRDPLSADGISPLQPCLQRDRRGAQGGRPDRGAAAAGRVARRRRESATASEIAKLAIERGLIDAYRQVFATLFWFLVLPGPAGAVLYRLTALLAEEWRGDAIDADGAAAGALRAAGARLLYWLDWIPVRLTAMTFAIVGDFEDAVYCWRTQAKPWPARHEGIVLASGAGALGCALGGIADGAGRRARISSRARHGRCPPTSTCCRARSASSGARCWCGWC